MAGGCAPRGLVILGSGAHLGLRRCGLAELVVGGEEGASGEEQGEEEGDAVHEEEADIFCAFAAELSSRDCNAHKRRIVSRG